MPDGDGRMRMPGSGMPITARGRSAAYAPPPWKMRGRTLALWYRLADPEEARRHVPAAVEMEDDPVVRARFWDMEHDALIVGADGERPWRRFREAVVAFPVRYGDGERRLPDLHVRRRRHVRALRARGHGLAGPRRRDQVSTRNPMADRVLGCASLGAWSATATRS